MPQAVQEREESGQRAAEALAPSRAVRRPKADIYESGDSLVVLVEMPGVDESSVGVEIEKNWITIYGKAERGLPEGYRLVSFKVMRPACRSVWATPTAFESNRRRH